MTSFVYHVKKQKECNMAHKPTKTQIVLSDYISFISPLIITEHKHGISYMDTVASRNKWREQIPYSNETEQFLINKSKLFIRMLDSRDSTSTNPVFLKALINEIADYLSAYTVRNPNVKRTRRTATKLMIQELWDNNSYILGLLLYQAEKRERKKDNQLARQNNRIRKPNKKAQRNFEIARQVRQEFADVNAYRHCKKK